MPLAIALAAPLLEGFTLIMKNTTLSLFAFSLCSMLIASAHAQSPNLIENGDFKDHTNSWKTYSHLPGKKPLVEIVSGPDQGSSAIQFTIPEAPDLKKHMVGFSQPIKHEILAESEIVVRFRARSPESLKIGVMIDTIAEPHRNKFYENVMLSPDWQDYELFGKKPEAFAQDESKLDFFLSFEPGQVEIANIEVMKIE